MTGTIVLVHGAWHRADCWDQLRKELHARGVTSHAVNLPSSITGPIDGELPGTAADAKAVGALLDQLPGPVLLVGHSYGGVVISAVAKHRSTGGLVYLAAFCLATGESAFDLAVGDPPPLTAQALT
jgi:pimeloyl-ACP methyl ester carboxylesterase